MCIVLCVARKKDDGRDCNVAGLWTKREPSPTAGDPDPELDTEVRM